MPVRLLIYEASHERLAPALRALGPGLEPVVMDPQGGLSLGGRPVSLEEAAPDAAWFNSEAMSGPARRDFAAALMKAPRLDWVHSAGAGFDGGVFERMVERGAILTTTHVQASSIADYVLWGVLDHL